jgi:hypothetical protein
LSDKGISTEPDNFKYTAAYEVTSETYNVDKAGIEKPFDKGNGYLEVKLDKMKVLDSNLEPIKGADYVEAEFEYKLDKGKSTANVESISADVQNKLGKQFAMSTPPSSYPPPNSNHT